MPLEPVPNSATAETIANPSRNRSLGFLLLEGYDFFDSNRYYFGNDPAAGSPTATLLRLLLLLAEEY